MRSRLVLSAGRYNRQKARVFAIFTLSFLLQAALFGPSASATHGGSCLKFVDASIGWANGGPTNYEGINYYDIMQREAMTDATSWHNYTDVNFSQVSWPGSTDVIDGFAWVYPDLGWRGVTIINTKQDECTLLSVSIRLNHSILKYDATNASRRKTACHELGHAIAFLGHREAPQDEDTTCMWPSGPTSIHTPDSHDRDAINVKY